MGNKPIVRKSPITVFTVTIQPFVKQFDLSGTFRVSNQDWRLVAPRRVLWPHESWPGGGLGDAGQQRSGGPTV
jgi:hypothetical protein